MVNIIVLLLTQHLSRQMSFFFLWMWVFSWLLYFSASSDHVALGCSSAFCY